MMKYILLGLLACSLFACQKDELEVYGEERFLFIPDSAGMDTAFVSFKHHLGQDNYLVPFEVRLIGAASETDMGYTVAVVDSLTTAAADDYVLPGECVFRAGRWKDTLWIKIVNTPHLSTETVKLTVTLVANEQVGVGFGTRLTASVTYNNMMSKPSWWDEDMDNLFLGPYSEAKYLAFYACTGLSDLTGLAYWRLRQLTLEFRDYIEEHQLKEANGEDMTVAGY